MISIIGDTSTTFGDVGKSTVINAFDIQANCATGQGTVWRTKQFVFADEVGAVEAIRVTPLPTGATAILVATGATSFKISQSNKTTNSGTGAKTTIAAQNETGTTSTGGALELATGTGTSANGQLILTNLISQSTVGAAGGASAPPATPTEWIQVTINGNLRVIPAYAQA